ncbi:MAG: hypothetical protein JKY56_10800 [Kofleriaceae bacterium]|nr:hypothetical protein [Kofleriaceae bacterium]
MPQQLVLALIGGGAIFLIGILVMIGRFYRKVDQGRALIINKMKAEPEVTFTGGVVLPVFHRAETMEISVKRIEIDRRGKEGLICMDNIRADIKVNFFIRVNKTREDVLRVAQAIGCERASDQKTLEDLFAAKFSEALKTVGKKLNFEQLYTQRDDFKDQIIHVIGKDLNGFVLDDAAIDYLEQTPLSTMDPHNILDAQGIRKITEITTIANVQTNELKQRERMEMGSQDLAADEAIYRFDQARADAEAKRDKEISISKARESNEAERLRLDEHQQTAVKQQKVQEDVSLAEIARQRALEVAEQARQREVQVEQVRVQRSTELEHVERDKEVTLRTIDKTKAVEIEKREIATVVSQRIAVEKGVAQEEEAIKDLRAHSDAKRTREVTVIMADAQAQEHMIKEVKGAEAQEEVAKSVARQRIVTAEADLDASDKEARAKIRLAEGAQAEEAASGLAAVRVREAGALAIEKQGLAEVKVREAAVIVTEREGKVEAEVLRERHLADAVGIEQKGLATAKAKQAAAEASERQGVADAVSLREKLMAEVIVKEADAAATEKMMRAEAAGLAAKADAMKHLDGPAKDHEEFRIRLEKRVEIAMEELRSKVEMAKHHSGILGEAMSNANFNIVGGDGEFFERFVRSVTLGQQIDGVYDNSEVLKKALGGYLDGDGDLLGGIKDIIASSGVDSETLKNLSIAGALTHLMSEADDGTKGKIKVLLDKAKDLGIG